MKTSARLYPHRHTQTKSINTPPLINELLPPPLTRQVREYQTQVQEFINNLRETGAPHVTLGNPVPDALTMARRKNELL